MDICGGLYNIHMFLCVCDALDQNKRSNIKLYAVPAYVRQWVAVFRAHPWNIQHINNWIIQPQQIWIYKMFDNWFQCISSNRQRHRILTNSCWPPHIDSQRSIQIHIHIHIAIVFHQYCFDGTKMKGIKMYHRLSRSFLLKKRCFAIV